MITNPVLEKTWGSGPAPRFKVGDRVRVIATTSRLVPDIRVHARRAGTVRAIHTHGDELLSYEVVLDRDTYPTLFYEEEIEPIQNPNPVHPKKWFRPPKFKRGDEVIIVKGGYAGIIGRITAVSVSADRDRIPVYGVRISDQSSASFYEDELELWSDYEKRMYPNPIYEKGWEDTESPQVGDVVRLKRGTKVSPAWLAGKLGQVVKVAHPFYFVRIRGYVVPAYRADIEKWVWLYNPVLEKEWSPRPPKFKKGDPVYVRPWDMFGRVRKVQLGVDTYLVWVVTGGGTMWWYENQIEPATEEDLEGVGFSENPIYPKRWRHRTPQKGDLVRFPDNAGVRYVGVVTSVTAAGSMRLVNVKITSPRRYAGIVYNNVPVDQNLELLPRQNPTDDRYLVVYGRTRVTGAVAPVRIFVVDKHGNPSNMLNPDGEPMHPPGAMLRVQWELSTKLHRKRRVKIVEVTKDRLSTILLEWRIAEAQAEVMQPVLTPSIPKIGEFFFLTANDKDDTYPEFAYGIVVRELGGGRHLGRILGVVRPIPAHWKIQSIVHDPATHEKITDMGRIGLDRTYEVTGDYSSPRASTLHIQKLRQEGDIFRYKWLHISHPDLDKPFPGGPPTGPERFRRNPVYKKWWDHHVPQKGDRVFVHTVAKKYIAVVLSITDDKEYVDVRVTYPTRYAGTVWSMVPVESIEIIPKQNPIHPKQWFPHAKFQKGDRVSPSSLSFHRFEVGTVLNIGADPAYPDEIIYKVEFDYYDRHGIKKTTRLWFPENHLRKSTAQNPIHPKRWEPGGRREFRVGDRVRISDRYQEEWRGKTGVVVSPMTEVRTAIGSFPLTQYKLIKLDDTGEILEVHRMYLTLVGTPSGSPPESGTSE